jgi:hypothetical protein
MAFAAAALTTNGLDRSWSIGPVKVQVMTWSVASGDTSGTITAPALTEIYQIILPTLQLSSAPTYSGNVATIAFADPGITVVGSVLCIGY